MTDDTSIWPLPHFFFEVELDGHTFRAQEVGGLDTETQVIEYRAGNSPVFSKIKMPGMVKSSNITLKKIVFANDNFIWSWFSDVKMNVIARKDMTIRLFDEAGAKTMVWHVKNAFPVKISGTDLKAPDNNIAIETIEIAHEGFVIENA